MFSREDIIKVGILAPFGAAAAYGFIWLAAAVVNVFAP
jgi:hypothetical protein